MPLQTFFRVEKNRQRHLVWWKLCDATEAEQRGVIEFLNVAEAAGLPAPSACTSVEEFTLLLEHVGDTISYSREIDCFINRP